MPSSPESGSPLRAHVTSSNGEISCSVEETNRIRAALGLKPLRLKPPPSVTTLPTEPAKPANNSTTLRERLSKARQRRLRLAATKSIAREAFKDNSSDDEEDDDLLAWVQASRARENADQKKSDVKRPRNVPKAKNDSSEKLRDSGLVAPSLPDDDLTENATLILADAPVVGGNDVLENVSKSQLRKRERSPEIDGANYDGTDAAEFAADKSDKPGAMSVAVGAMQVESDYRVDATAEKVFAKRKRERRAFKKRKRVKDDDVVVKGRMDDLRKRKKEQQEVESGEEDALYESLTRARRVAMRKEEKRSVDAILEAINKANEAEGNDEAAAEDAEKIVYSEMKQFLSKLPSATDVMSESDKEMSVGAAVPASGKKEDEFITPGGRDNFPAAGLDVHKEEEIEIGQRNEVEGMDVSREEEGHTKVQKETEFVFDDTERGGQSGVAGFLQRLRARGTLKEKQEQHGRARDKRFNDQDEDVDDTNQGEPEIKLRYTDDQGNELTRKEAFRQLCHKFHGNAPGQNKREKRLRKMLGDIKARNTRYDDTPLASAAALKKETRRVGEAHVVLSGSGALPKKR
eukprot:GFKZ01008671.1.p1 GENE.GFKZ01008671.1~~GFKZ01008671.1.p1  ORF type:complete len:575 (+),score=130.28 GFKZ01008671.1:64-1788(+)